MTQQRSSFSLSDLYLNLDLDLDLDLPAANFQSPISERLALFQDFKLVQLFGYFVAQIHKGT